MADLPPLIEVGEDKYEVWGYVGCVMYVIIDVILITIVTNHGFKIYQDLFTPERKSVNHRRKKPTINLTYKLNLYFSMISCIFWALAFCTMLFTYVAATTDLACAILQKFAASFAVLAKIWMYLVFLVRLHTIYGTSAHAVSKKCMIISATAIIIYNIGIIIFLWIVWDSEIFGYDDGVYVYPNYCEGTLEIISAVLYIFGDGVCSAGFLYAFIVPLRRTMMAVKMSSLNQSAITSSQFKAQEKIAYIGTKTTLLTVVAIISSFNFSLGTTLTDLNFIIGFDSVFNSICIVLMTPYYPDSTYYLKLCYPCVWLFAKKQLIYKHDDDDNDNNKDNKQKKTDDRAQSIKLETTTHRNDFDTIQDTQDTNITVSPTSYDTDIQLQKTAQELHPPLQNDDTYDQINDDVNM